MASKKARGGPKKASSASQVSSRGVDFFFSRHQDRNNSKTEPASGNGFAVGDTRMEMGLSARDSTLISQILATEKPNGENLELSSGKRKKVENSADVEESPVGPPLCIVDDVTPPSQKRLRIFPKEFLPSQDDSTDQVIWEVTPAVLRLQRISMGTAGREQNEGSMCSKQLSSTSGTTTALENEKPSSKDGVLREMMITASTLHRCSGETLTDMKPLPSEASAMLENWFQSPELKSVKENGGRTEMHGEGRDEADDDKENARGRCGEATPPRGKKSASKLKDGLSFAASRRICFDGSAEEKECQSGSRKKSDNKSTRSRQSIPKKGQGRKGLLDLLDRVESELSRREGQRCLVQETEAEKISNENTNNDENNLEKEGIAIDGVCSSSSAGSKKEVEFEGWPPDLVELLEGADLAALFETPGKERGPVEGGKEERETDTTRENESDRITECNGLNRELENDLRLALREVTAELNGREGPESPPTKGSSTGGRQHFVVVEVTEEEYVSSNGVMLQKALKLCREGSKEFFVVLLRDEWISTPVESGHRVGIIGDFDSNRSCIVDGENNLCILHPDVLISGSQVGSSFMCPRRSVISDRIQSQETSVSALHGTLLHQLFQAALRMRKPAVAALEEEARSIMQRHVEKLYVIGVEESSVYKHLQENIPKILEWVHGFLTKEVPKTPNVEFGWNGNSASVAVAEVVDIEESVWSPRYGLKGMIDVTARVKIRRKHSKFGTQIGTESAEPVDAIVPLELKTGKATTGQAAIEHRAQVILYTLLVAERYEAEPGSGLLHYLQPGRTQGVEAARSEVAGILARRNEHAQSLLQAAATQRLPAMLKSAHICRNCYQLDSCALYHKAVEGGTEESSGLGEVFADRTGHLSEGEGDFLRRWNRLIDLEMGAIEERRRGIWAVESSAREREGLCIGGMLLESCDVTRGQPEGEGKISGGKFTYTFRRRGASPVETAMGRGERGVLSTESGHVAVSTNCIIEEISADFLKVSLPRRLQLHGNRHVSSSDRLWAEVWRFDKDESASIGAQMRSNLMQLFGRENADTRRRRLMVDLEAPSFGISCPESSDPADAHLNEDQKQAVKKMLSAEDYALILGMPGSGKTSTIVQAVKKLVAEGKSVLLTSYTNSAVDNVLLKLLKEGVQFLRVGRTDAVHPGILPYTLFGEGRRVGSTAEIAREVAAAQVVGATCLAASGGLLARKRFDMCIVDEAGQVTLPVCLGPLRCARTFVLVGDPHQLPPLVKSEAARAGGMAESLFSRLANAHPTAVSALRCQFRMCADVMLLSNELVYGGRLSCASPAVATACLHVAGLSELRDGKAAGRLPYWLLHVVEPKNRVIFLDTDALPATETRLQGNRHNAGEAALLIRIAETLVAGGVKGSLGAMSPYGAQVRLLRRLKEERGLEGLEVDTVDRFQGRDKDCIFLSFVSSNEEKRISERHVADLQRLNVALTRAAKKLILIGSRSTLSSSSTLSHLLRLIDEKGWSVALPTSALSD